tara:strand:- start:474 stop:617 length:144 start_codon:yes stop_codon:yes gene_type:complete
MLLFSFSNMVLHRVIVLVSSGLRLVMHVKGIVGRFYRIVSRQIFTAS